MFTQSKALLLAAVMLGAAGARPALAEKDYDVLEPYGGPTQTWQDIERSRQNMERRVRKLEGIKSGAADDPVVSPRPKHLSRKLHREPRGR